MKLKEILSFFNELVPFSLQESYDNSGIQIGSPDQEIKGALLCIDVTLTVLKEAVEQDLNLVISHHPLIFHPLKSLTGKNEMERVILQAIRQNIAVLSVHTNADIVAEGVNGKICDKLGLINRAVLAPAKDRLLKLVFFVPKDHSETVRNAIFNAGAGVIGNYDQCSFNLSGQGTFRGGENADPFVGKKGELHVEDEMRVETILPVFLKNKILRALMEAHPYEEVAYDLYPLANDWPRAGMGLIAEFEEEMEEYDFLNALKTVFNAGCIRYTALLEKKVKKVAVCGGSGSSLLNRAISSGADAFVSADFKYHQFFEAEGKILIADIGHYESEQFTKELFYEAISKKFPKFAVRLSEVNTNPINYL